MKIKSLFFGIAMLLSMTSAFAQGGTTGPLTWKLDNGTLTISGKGTMPNYESIDIYDDLTHELIDIISSAPWGKFYGSIKSAIIESGVASIGKLAFFKCHVLFSIDIPNGIIRIGDGAFAECHALSSITLPNSVTKVDAGAFYNCLHLTSITLPNRSIDFEVNVFMKCSKLTSITNLNPTPQVISPDVFEEFNISACTLYVLKSSVLAYRHAEVWKEFNIVGINVGNEELEITNYELRVYPNPATGACSITLPDEFLYESALTLSVYDASGKLVQQIAMDNSGEIPQLKMGLEAKGVYVVVVSNGRKEYKGKVVFN